MKIGGEVLLEVAQPSRVVHMEDLVPIGGEVGDRPLEEVLPRRFHLGVVLFAVVEAETGNIGSASAKD